MHTAAQATQSQIKRRRFHISAGAREYITVNLALLLKAALPIGEALESIRESSKSKPLRQAVDQIQQDIDVGTPLWQALENTGTFPSQTIALIRIGEQSGNLVENLAIAVAQETKQRTLTAKIRAAMLYPAFVIGLTIIVGLAVAWFLLPRLNETFTQLGVQLPQVTRIMLGFGSFLKTNGWWAVSGSAALIFLAAVALSSAAWARSFAQRILLYTPGISRLIREIELSRFGHLTGSLLDSGLSIVQSLELMSSATSSPAYRNLYRHMASSFEQGFSFKESLRSHPGSMRLIPLPVQQIIIAGERSGSLPESLESIGANYEERADITTRGLEAILEPALLLIVAGGVLVVAISIILPIYSLTNGLGAQ